MPNAKPGDERELADAIRRAGRNDLKAFLQERENALAPVPFSTTRPRYRWRLLAAAAVLLPLFVVALYFLFLSSPDHQQLASAATFSYPNVATEPIVRAGANDDNLSLRTALNRYEAGELKTAAADLSALPKTDTTVFYRAVIAANEGAYKEALNLLNEVPEGSSFNQPAQYFRAVALLATGNAEAARTLLEPSEQWADYPGLQRRVEAVLEEL